MNRRERLRQWLIKKLGGYAEPPPRPEHKRYLALFDKNGNEIQGQGYQRGSFDLLQWDGSEGMKACNLNRIDFGEAMENWGLIAKMGAFDEKGNLMFKKDIDIAKNVFNGDTATFAQGDFRVAFILDDEYMKLEAKYAVLTKQYESLQEAILKGSNEDVIL